MGLHRAPPRPFRMSLSMTRSEREAFLSAVHVGVISIERAGQPPLAVPIWYDYDPAIGVWVITGKDSEKGRALGDAGRFALCAQSEAPPIYRYVSVEGRSEERRVGKECRSRWERAQ